MHAFPPLISGNPVVLILGSMPSQTSLAKQQYYAHPRNIFWWLMADIFEFDDSVSYASRVEFLTAAGVAVWDVLQQCEREGSLDSSIQRSTELVNDFAAFFRLNPSVKLIAFNGAAAKQIFMRHCLDVLQQNPDLEWCQLPSSSPAYAAMNKQQKLKIWNQALPTDLAHSHLIF